MLQAEQRGLPQDFASECGQDVSLYRHTAPCQGTLFCNASGISAVPRRCVSLLFRAFTISLIYFVKQKMSKVCWVLYIAGSVLGWSLAAENSGPPARTLWSAAEREQHGPHRANKHGAINRLERCPVDGCQQA